MQCIMLRKETVRKMYLRASSWPFCSLQSHYQSTPSVELDACVQAGCAAQTFQRSPARLMGARARHTAGAGATVAAQSQQIRDMARQHGHVKASVKKNPAKFQYNRCNNCICSAGSCWPTPSPATVSPSPPQCPEQCPAAQGGDAAQPRLSQGPPKLSVCRITAER